MIVQNKKLKGRRISVDGGSFESCEFDNCTLIYSGYLPVNFDRCKFNVCNWEFTGPALNAVHFMRAIYAGGATDLIENTFDQIRGQKPGPGPTLH